MDIRVVLLFFPQIFAEKAADRKDYFCVYPLNLRATNPIMKKFIFQ